jgi:hypothetical protein
MKFVATDLDNENSSVTLGDSDDGDAISGFFPAGNPIVDIVDYIQGDYPDFISQYNNSISFKLLVYKEHDDFDAAMAYCTDHPGEVPPAAKITLTWGLKGKRISRQAKIVPSITWHVGAGTITEYTITSQLFLTENESNKLDASII